jgi:two-component system phosphate regulon response regulator PhoB
MKTPHVLVVEDEEDLRDVPRFDQQREGFSVSGASTREEGLALTRDRRPDLVLFDLMSPG